MKVLYVIAFVLLGMATVVSAQENGNIEQLLDANDVYVPMSSTKTCWPFCKNCGWLL